MADTKNRNDSTPNPRSPVDTSLINQHAIDIRKTKEDLNQKIDVRNTVTYTFKGTGVETFDHKLGRVPVGHVISIQSKAGVISGDTAKWTSRRVSLRSSVAGNKVTFLFH
jgi:hypothetical protein